MNVGEDGLLVTVLDNWNASVAFGVGVTPVPTEDTKVVVVDVAPIRDVMPTAVIVADVFIPAVVFEVPVVD